MNIKGVWLSIAMILFGFAQTSSAQKSVLEPEKVAQALVDSYNARNMDGILAAYAADSVAYELPSGKVILKGHDEIRKKFSRILDPNVSSIRKRSAALRKASRLNFSAQ